MDENHQFSISFLCLVIGQLAGADLTLMQQVMRPREQVSEQ
jgi:hypothetical protein